LAGAKLVPGLEDPSEPNRIEGDSREPQTKTKTVAHIKRF